MKDRSPIIDIEHTYLYSPRTIAALLSGLGFEVKETGSVKNRCSLSYLMRLVPVPSVLKKSFLAILDGAGLGRVPLRVPLGNLYLIARKPCHAC
jgi:hypothetical protein